MKLFVEFVESFFVAADEDVLFRVAETVARISGTRLSIRRCRGFPVVGETTKYCILISLFLLFLNGFIVRGVGDGVAIR